MVPASIAEQCIASCQHMLPALGFDRIGQLGFLVDDVEPWCREHGAELGVESWYRPNIRRCKQLADGRRLDQQFEIVVGYTGGVQIEVVKVEGTDGAIFKRRQMRDRFRPHHVGIFVDDMAGTRARLESEGYATLQSGLFSFARWSKTRVAYFDTTDAFGMIVEVIENRFMKLRIDLPEWFVNLGIPMGYVTRL